ncbi:unnamed protein product [Bursaphelenchus okinawaensis]|uniref:G_PROTEIN_RECEP_F1_2 domain-containing protein n=1 Tax=Bursaphelenchus okinawaensis TaxID=465554 RepID=A0A811KP21_9BILA|nr:unnamed protein product [Bursaphelenchus okinawaensis]CAG9107048.1 unnamed protein product [Bursaphelenchus okinawaensis]
MNKLIEFFWANDIIGSFLGVILSTALISAVYERRKAGKMHPYSQIVLVLAINDFFFCFVECCLQHILAFGHYKMFVTAHGVEHYLLSDTYYPITFIIHMFFLMNTITFLPAVYSYRYEFIKNANGTYQWKHLLSRISISLVFSLCCAASGGLAVHRSLQNSREFYLELIPEVWISNNKTYFVYAVDVENVQGISWMAFTCTESTIAMVCTLYYALKTYKVMKEMNINVTAKTKSMQTEFTKSLISQTLVVLFMANTPASAVFFCIIFGYTSNYVGTLILWPFSWVSACASLLTFYFIKDYRCWIYEKVGYRKDVVEAYSVSTSHVR